jgi:hypothetical protein
MPAAHYTLSGYLPSKILVEHGVFDNFRETPVNIEKCCLVNSLICNYHLKVSLANIEKRLTG